MNRKVIQRDSRRMNLKRYIIIELNKNLLNYNIYNN